MCIKATSKIIEIKICKKVSQQSREENINIKYAWGKKLNLSHHWKKNYKIIRKHFPIKLAEIQIKFSYVQLVTHWTLSYNIDVSRILSILAHFILHTSNMSCCALKISWMFDQVLFLVIPLQNVKPL
jgi:hypothetical protein